MSAQLVRKSVTLISTGGSTQYSAVVQMTPQNPCQVSLAVELISGAMSNGQVLVTVDDVSTSDAQSAAVWFQHPFLNGLDANALGNIDKPVSGVKFANDLAGQVKLTVLQMVGN